MAPLGDRCLADLFRSGRRVFNDSRKKSEAKIFRIQVRDPVVVLRSRARLSQKGAFLPPGLDGRKRVFLRLFDWDRTRPPDPSVAFGVLPPGPTLRVGKHLLAQSNQFDLKKKTKKQAVNNGLYKRGGAYPQYHDQPPGGGGGATEVLWLHLSGNFHVLHLL